jgi:hypothetical protein
MASLDYIFSLSRVQDYGIGGHRAFLPFQSHTRGVESIAPSQGAIFRGIFFSPLLSLFASSSFYSSPALPAVSFALVSFPFISSRVTITNGYYGRIFSCE